ncbi:MAG: LPS export ABC transporter ATP-binding protein [Oligoflexia bacterium]|nr:LPS export ABC transporter ATP-binding protein [Oligoflexia bacterium]
MHTLSLHDIVKSYSGRRVVDHVSIQIASSEIIGLLGPNGAGKTTTFYACVGLVAPEQGIVLLDDQDITNEPMYIRARLGIGYLPQEASIFRKMTVHDNIMSILETVPFPSAQARKQRHEELVEFLGLAKILKSLGSSLSGGERRRVEITRALARSPHFILLDEPFAGIDPLAVRDIQGIILRLKETGIGVLITDHNVRETLGICDRAYIMVDGKVLEEGSPQHIAESERAQRYYLGDNFSL